MVPGLPHVIDRHLVAAEGSDLPALLDLYGEHAVLVGHDRRTALGHGEIRRVLANRLFERSRWRPRSIEAVTIAADLVVLDVTIDNDGDPIVVREVFVITDDRISHHVVTERPSRAVTARRTAGMTLAAAS